MRRVPPTNVVPMDGRQTRLPYCDVHVEGSVKTCVYGLVDPRDERVRYVGWTTNTARRLREHIKESLKGSRSHKCCWIRAVLSTGREPSVTVLEESPRAGIRSREMWWMRQFSDLTNVSPGGDTEPWGWNKGLTKETDVRVARAAAALSRSARGSARRLGMTNSPEMRARQSLSAKASWTPERRARQSGANHHRSALGKPGYWTGRTKENDVRVAAKSLKTSVSSRGKVPWNKGKKGAAQWKRL